MEMYQELAVLMQGCYRNIRMTYKKKYLLIELNKSIYKSIIYLIQKFK